MLRMFWVWVSWGVARGGGVAARHHAWHSRSERRKRRVAVPSRAVSTGGVGKRGEQMPVEGQSRVRSLQWKNPEGVGAGGRVSRLGCAHVEPECESPGLKAACFDELKSEARGQCLPVQQVNFSSHSHSHEWAGSPRHLGSTTMIFVTRAHRQLRRGVRHRGLRRAG